MNAAAPGWYPDPEHPAMVRWYDGYAWTEHRTPRTPPRKPRSTGVVVAVVIGSVVALVLVLGVLAAIAIPVVLHQQEKNAAGQEQMVDDDYQLPTATVAQFKALTCKDVAAEAALFTRAVAEPGDAWLESTDSMIVINDQRAVLRLPESGHVFVMRCSGAGTWNDTEKTPLVINLYTNHAGEYLFEFDWDL